MNLGLFKLAVRMKQLVWQDEGQDMVEYAMVVALIVIGATAGTKAFATSLATVFSHVGSITVSNS